MENPVENNTVRREEIDQNTGIQYIIEYIVEPGKNEISKLTLYDIQKIEDYTYELIYTLTAPEKTAVRMVVHKKYAGETVYLGTIEIGEYWLEKKAWFFNVNDLEDTLNTHGVIKTFERILRAIAIWTRHAIYHTIDGIEQIL